MRTVETYTAVAASLTGFASNVTGASWALTATDPGDSLAHKVTIRNDSATDHSAKTLPVSGKDANGAAQSETVNLPAGAATVTTTKYYSELNTPLVPSATIGADTMDIGWAVDSVTPDIRPEVDQETFALAFGCEIDSGTPNYTAQGSVSGVTYTNHGTVASKTAAAEGTYTTAISALRLLFTAAGGVTITVLQAGRKHK